MAKSIPSIPVSVFIKKFWEPYMRCLEQGKERKAESIALAGSKYELYKSYNGKTSYIIPNPFIK